MEVQMVEGSLEEGTMTVRGPFEHAPDYRLRRVDSGYGPGLTEVPINIPVAYTSPSEINNVHDQSTATTTENGLHSLAPEPHIESTETAPDNSQPLFSAFSKYEKLFIIIMVTLASFFSPLSGQIYYPVMPTLVRNYHLTPELINLTITTYLILQGLAPSFMGTFADTGGRRPAYIIAFTVYTAANIGLALQNSFAALLILRCLQSAGSSGTVAFGYGVIADIATTAERGKYIGPMAAGVMVAPALGPVIGGLLAKFLGWRSIFWFLTIVSGGYLVFYVLAMPETARKIVGNGNAVPHEWWRKSVFQWWSKRQAQSGEEDTGAEESQQFPHTKRLRFPNPLKSFVILLECDALIIISYIGIVMFSNIALLTSTPNLFGPLYGFNELQIGLCFLPLGVSSCLGAVLYGKVIDYNYKRTAQNLGFPVDREKGDDLRGFPIERARLQTVFPVMAIGVGAFIPYGWVLQQRVHLAAPLVLQFIIGFCFVASLNCLNTLLVDLFPDKPATAASACNLVRCCLGAVGAAVISQILSGMGWGWCFFSLGLVMAVGMGLLWVENMYGMGWREKRLLKIERKKAEKEARAAEIRVEGKADRREQDDTNAGASVSGADVNVTGGTGRIDNRSNQ
ncbi:Major facilitator superfamily domain, general substrate transporter [Penicillium griseofulvum]|uniref:Major facilitator superfamily domain, general substrate transporter n=1 Tax=Penicillium patulum TaxID=5078 RepID=A0A135LPJ1_PENPA|nr:Major facilitator superfamily domain, general substrate transporter [Penicillium griseofulvum]KXG50894.1 Major facilitator superfamily domain, general substrate transporter [Penicillium griseofulvum]